MTTASKKDSCINCIVQPIRCFPQTESYPMRLTRLFAIGLTLVASSAPVLAQTPAFDPKSWKGTQAGKMTQVLTLGSAHLAQLKSPSKPEQLAPLLDKLAAFNPDIITHEGLSGEQCDIVQRYAARYPNIYKDYCWDTVAAEKATGLTVPAAMEAVEKTLGSWPAKPSAADRRKLAATFLAANDRPSALVQWLQLPAAERRLGDGIDQPLIDILAEASKRPNETIAIGVALAVRLGHNRVYAVDDHTADSIQGLAGPGFEEAIQKIWSRAETPEMANYKSAETKLVDSGDMLSFYRLLNKPETQRLFITFDFGAALKQDTPELYGRQYTAWYEARNLRMVANIRAAFGNKPGARVLNIVGASHKAYYDAYLDLMSDVQLVDADAVLR